MVRERKNTIYVPPNKTAGTRKENADRGKQKDGEDEQRYPEIEIDFAFQESLL